MVKFNATGMEIRSTIERSVAISDWLDMHGDLIQVLVLQNYLFFGNASSILNYIATMFEDVAGSDSVYSSFDLPPKPKVLIIDMSLNTGTSIVLKEYCSIQMSSTFAHFFVKEWIHQHSTYLLR